MLNRHAHVDAVRPSDDGLPDVGLFIDDERSIAAVSRPSRANPSLHVASLHSTVLYVHADGSASLGGTDDPNAAKFTEFIGTEVDSGFEPGELVAMALHCLLAEVARTVGTDVANLAAAATFPAEWTAERVSSVRTSMNRHGLGHVALVSETEALAAWAETTHATWAGKDSGIAAARGAAAIASEYPVEAVTEEIVLAGAVASRTTPVLTRTPVLAAIALAAVLALGGGVASLLLQDTAAPEVPVIEGAPFAAPTTTSSAPGTLVPFPTVVPIIEPVLPPPVPTTTENVSTPAEPTAAPEPLGTRPASETQAPVTSDETPTEDTPDLPTPEPETSPEEPVEPSPEPETPTPTDEETPTSPGDVAGPGTGA